MTHGEEPGPETHQDSAVLTYLEGLLMHQVAGGQGAAATQSGNQEQRNKDGTGHAQPSHGTRHEQNRTNSHCGASQHLRKARLLNSETWAESETQRRSAPSIAINGQSEEHHSGHNCTSQDKGESTLLASLLQSFSSRLQNVTLPQQIIQGLRPLDAPCQISKPAQEERADVPCHRPASSHLKGLVSKSKMHNHSNSVPYQRQRPSQESFSESPKALQSSTPSPSPESLSCTERLKAVANLVNIRSSPAPSPKPSVACSQLALLLSSEAHLQEYSREHALKAQLSGRSASERLSAMATQQTQDKQPTTSGLTHGLSLLHTKNGILSEMSTSSSRQSPSLTSGQRTEGSIRTGHCFRERRPFEKQGRPAQNCSSLLLQLLNSHNTSQRINGQGHLKDDFSTFGTLASPLFSDSEHSNPDSSLTKDSSDAESSYSGCSPIDLSLKTRTNVQTPVSTSSSPVRDRVPESLLNRWKYESPPVKVISDRREVNTCSEMKSNHKVTLLQLLLDHKNNERVNKGLDNPDLQQDVIPKVTSSSTSSQSVFSTVRCRDISDLSGHSGLICRSPKLLPPYSQSRDSNSSTSPYTPYGSPHSQSVPLDLCKIKQPASDVGVKEPAFSASKLLQNLAQCGKQNPDISPPAKAPLPPIKLITQELNVNHPPTLLGKLNAPIQRNNTLWEEAKAKTSAVPEATLNVSEIENLLERRTVLQLLLGNAPQKEKVGSKRKREHGKNNSVEKPTHQATGQTNGSALDITIKTEPVEEGHTYDYNKMSKHCQNPELEPRKCSSYDSHENIKQEPLSPEVPIRNGLLCHLLKKRPNNNLKPNKLENLNKSCVKEESVETQGPTIPKKRKFSIELEYYNSSTQQIGDLVPSGNTKEDNSGCFASRDLETRVARDSSSPPEADSPPARFPPYESDENRSFNVLKQLLLSDNCLKELSQPRGTFSLPSHTVLNGNTITQSCNGEIQNFHQSLSPSNASSKKASSHRQETPHVTQQEPARSKISYSTTKDLKAPAKMVSANDQTQMYGPDSPRFTKTNPILYYMLQRSNAQLVKEGERLEVGSGQMQTNVKNESSGDTEAFEL
ncbi:nuclear receptor-interacting protein 1 [Carassius auratus]|uniref:Nuclear receptor-interacting protein 1-like n=1 Tax=Carassius auratus TaxID=7957 RepID=A0A6P6LCL5_CARAU|nr:nuclear receptor-interacting protein 1-like [Carassius auratus]XP_026082356.1 nuclear receptor-interacting protein 1-like [Carassius auratus]